MKVEKIDGRTQRRILTSMIVDKAVLGAIAMKWTKEGLFSDKWSNLIGKWCCNYFERYEKAPGQDIEGIFEKWAEKTNDEETVELIERFLDKISEQYESEPEFNSTYMIDTAAEYFNRVRLEKLAETIKADIQTGDLAQAQKRVDSFSNVEIGAAMGVDVLSDKEAIKRAFASKSKPLVVYPGALGEFYKDVFERDAFVSFMAPEKRGKTFWLLDVAWRGMEQGLRVAFFQIGDLSEGQMMRRFMVRACKRPLKPQIVRIPIEIAHDPDSFFATVEHEEKEYEKHLSWKLAWKRVSRMMDKGREGLLRLSCHPNSSINVNGIAATIDGWIRSGWGTPDLVVIDYADLIAPLYGHADTRDQINETWKKLRALSQKLHCCVVTATQSDSDSYNADTLGMGNFSEDKRKLAHVTAMIGINQTPAEKSQGLQRMNLVVCRENESVVDDVCHVAGCLSIANPAMLSIF